MGFKVGTQVRFIWGKEIYEGEITAHAGWYSVQVPPKDKPYPIVYPVLPEDIVGVIYKNELESDQSHQPELQETEPEKTPAELEREKLRRFFFGESPELSNVGKQRKAEGKCPVCGEDGRIHLSTFICSKHGTY